MTGMSTDGIKKHDIMKYLKYTYWLFAALMVSCSVQETEVPVPVAEEDVEFYASIESEPTRAYVDEKLMVLWNADDRVSRTRSIMNMPLPAMTATTPEHSRRYLTRTS